jgi:flavin reductase (DIM6/NTAB) family NADH-FMN oxidoreductase RutF
MQIHFPIAELQSWSRFYRGNFINCLSGFKSASLISSINTDGDTNLAIFSNIIHLGADPALIGFINRPREAAPHTISNIEANGWYTINHIHPDIIEQAHQTSAKYQEGESEFGAVGLTPEWKEGIPVPYVKESLVKYAMQLVEIIPITHNNTFLVIGTVKEAWVEEKIIEEDGFLALEKVNSITTLGVDGYYETNRIARYSYAKPGESSREII